MAGEIVEFTSDGGTAGGYLSLPASGGGPGVIVLQEWWGLVPHIKDVADRFAAEGFVALAPDLYHGEKTKSPDETGKLMMALDIVVRAQDVGLSGQIDAAVLSWAATEGRVLLTHDAQTMPAHAYESVLSAQLMAGVLVVQQEAPTGHVIGEVILLAECSLEGEWGGQVNYLPLK